MSKEEPTDEEYDHFKDRDQHHTTSDFETFVHVLTSILGTGILSLPYAIAQSGTLVGGIGILALAITVIHCDVLLVKCSQMLCRRRKIPFLNFADTAQEAFIDGPNPFPKWSKCIRYFVNFFLITSTLGVCGGYVVFISVTVKSVVDYYVEDEYRFDSRLYMAFLFPLLALINLFSDLKYLAPVSMTANVCLIIEVTIVFYYVFQDFPSITSAPLYAGIVDFAIFFGLAVFAFVNIQIVLSLEKHMKHPKRFIRAPFILQLGALLVTIIYAFFGVFAYIKYQEETKSIIMLNLPEGEILADCTKILAATVVLMTYPIQFFVPNEIVFTYLESKAKKCQRFLKYITSTMLVLVTVLLAISIPKFHIVVSLVACFGFAMLGFVVPPLIQICTYHKSPGWGRCYWILWKDVLLIIYGVLGFVVGTGVTIYLAIIGK